MSLGTLSFPHDQSREIESLHASSYVGPFMPIRSHGCSSLMNECSISFLSLRLFDIVHADQKLYLVFEFLDVDLKRYMENGNKTGRPITPAIVKVRPLIHSPLSPLSTHSTRFVRVFTRI